MNLQTHFLLLPLFLILSSTPRQEFGNSDTISGRVIKVKDGDTIEILVEGKVVVVRLEHIDCPEKRQPFGTAAKKFTSDKCFGKTVKVMNSNKKDRNGRLIGVILTADGKNLNKELVKAGMAWHFKKYSSDQTYQVLEDQARKLKRGLWKDEYPVAPWEWRHPSSVKP